VRQAALAENDVQRMAAWAGQSAALARPEPAADFVRRIWAEVGRSYRERHSGEVPGMTQMITQSVNRTDGRKQLPKR
jgi:hypothetical protein